MIGELINFRNATKEAMFYARRYDNKLLKDHFLLIARDYKVSPMMLYEKLKSKGVVVAISQDELLKNEAMYKSFKREMKQIEILEKELDMEIPEWNEIIVVCNEKKSGGDKK